MNNVIFIFFRLLCVSFATVLMGASANADTSVKSKLQLSRAGFEAISAEYSRAKFKASADKFGFDAESQTMTLNGHVAVTVLQEGQPDQAFRGDTAQIQNGEIERQIHAGNATEVDAGAPVRDLVKALLPAGSKMSYRVYWYFSVFSDSRSGYALYDRERGILREYIRDSDEQYSQSSRWEYTNVTDEILKKFARDYMAKYAGRTRKFDFEALTSYGCKRETLNPDEAEAKG